MATGTSKGTARLRRSGIIGLVSVLVLAGTWLPSSDAAAQTPQKWHGSLDALGRGGSENGGQLDLFQPLFQNNNTLFFGNAIGALDSDDSSGANFGVGLRHIFNNSFILGGYGYFDWLHSPNSNTFYQATAGVEAMSANWDLRLNGYIPFGDSQDVLNIPATQGTTGVLGDPVVAVEGNEIGLLREGVGGSLGQDGLLIQERPLGGIEGEVGYRLPFGNALGSNTETRVFMGGYAFWGDGYPTYAGPRGRVEFRLYDLPWLRDGSRLTAGGEVSWDNPRGAQGEASLRLRIPLNIFSGGSQPQLSDLDRRMTDPVPVRVLPIYAQHEEVIPATPGNVPLSTFEAVKDTETGREIESIYFASGNGTSGNSGQQGSATDLTDAITRAGTNGMVVLTGSGGSVTGQFGLLEGQILLGGASNLQVTGITSGTTLTYMPGLTRPTVVESGPDGPFFTPAINVTAHDHVKIQGVDITVNSQSTPPNIQTTGVLLQDSANDIVRDVKVTGGDAGFTIFGMNRVTSNDLFNNISGTGSSYGLVVFSFGSDVSNLKVDTANFDSLHGPNSGDLGTGFAASNVGGGGTISNIELDNVSITNTGNGGSLHNVNGLTINGWTGNGGNAGDTGGIALQVSGGSGLQLSNFSMSNYRDGVSVFNNGTGNTIDGTTQGIIKDIGTNITVGTSGASGIDVINSTLTINKVTISGIGSTAETNDFDIIINNPSTVTVSNVSMDGKNTGGTAVTEAAVLLSGNAGVIAIQSGSTGNSAVNVPQVCRNNESGTATTTGAISFTNPAATTCP